MTERNKMTWDMRWDGMHDLWCLGTKTKANTQRDTTRKQYFGPHDVVLSCRSRHRETGTENRRRNIVWHQIINLLKRTEAGRKTFRSGTIKRRRQEDSNFKWLQDLLSHGLRTNQLVAEDQGDERVWVHHLMTGRMPRYPDVQEKPMFMKIWNLKELKLEVNFARAV